MRQSTEPRKKDYFEETASKIFAQNSRSNKRFNWK